MSTKSKSFGVSMERAFVGAQVFMSLLLVGCGSDSAKPSVDAASDGSSSDSGSRSDTQTTGHDGPLGWMDTATEVSNAKPQFDGAIDTTDSGQGDSRPSPDFGSLKDAAGDTRTSDAALDYPADRAFSPDLVGPAGDTASDDGVDGGASAGEDGSSPDGASSRCTVAGATECKNRLTLRTCKDGVWTETACGSMKICLPGAPAACIGTCSGLTPPSNAAVVCTMPVDPTAAYAEAVSTWNDAPMTTVSVTSDPEVMPRSAHFGATMDGRDLADISGDVCAPVVADSSTGLAWRTPAPTHSYGRIYAWGFFELQDFVKKYGARPAGISLYMKTRRLPASGALTPIPVFILWSSVDTNTGDYAPVTEFEDDSSTLSPGTDWTIVHRDFTKDEIAALSIDDTVSRWEVGFSSSLGIPEATQPPENVEIAWYALVMTPPL